MKHRLSSRIEEIVAGVRKDLDGRKKVVPFSDLVKRAGERGSRREIRRRLDRRPGIIAEVKRASPSQGWIRKELDAGSAARRYAEAGACAVSVLTEGRFFGGSLADLSAASEAAGETPVLRKDFLLDEYMLAEARAHGADLALLIVAVLRNGTARMVRTAGEHGLEPLVEVHDEEELAIAEDAGATIIGINNRDLATLRVDLRTAERLLPKIPGGAIRVVESGISSAGDVRRFTELGADAFLVGEALVRAEDPALAIRNLLHEAIPAERQKEGDAWKRRSS